MRVVPLLSRCLAAALFAGLAWSPAIAQNTLKIGAPTSQSGRYVAFGAQAKRGIEHAVDVWKATRGDTVAGRSIELVMVDIQSDNAITVSVMNDMIKSKNVHVIIGPDGSNAAAAAVPPWKKAPERPVWILPGGSTTRIEQEVGDDKYFFHTYAWAYHYHSNNAEALKRALGAGKRVAIIYTDGAYGRAHIDSTRKYLKEAGFDIVSSELVREGSSDFNSAIVKVRALRPDVLYAVMQTNDAIQFTKQVHTAKTGIKYLVGTAQAQLPEWQEGVGDAQECWTGVTTWIPGLGFPADKREPKLFPDSNSWEAAWRAKFKREPEFLEPGYYASTILALLAVEATKSTDRDKLVTWLEQQEYMTPLGNSKFTKSEVTPHQAFSNMVVFQRVKGKDGFSTAVIYPPEIAKAKLQPCS
ncbi:MAG TPA: ABC transporter substrate-binding protein [Burkholderiaceae bacterium]|nr:ABC transporter substrate-binding protein [Burkholderiaceae bacterium]HQR75264.1 ABC transporter substrate-binding protein [Burkholderiaceae bacterium]